MNDKMIEFLKALSDKLGHNAEWAFRELVQYTRVEAIFGVIIGVVLFAAAFASTYILIKRVRRDYDFEFSAFLCALVVLGLGTTGMVIVFTYLPNIFAPEGATLEKLIRGIGH
jgi:heme A synthase